MGEVVDLSWHWSDCGVSVAAVEHQSPIAPPPILPRVLSNYKIHPSLVFIVCISDGMADHLSQHRVNTDNVNCYNVSNSYNNTVNVNAPREYEDQEILEWLSPLEPRRRHHRSGPTESMVWEIGSWELRNSEDGVIERLVAPKRCCSVVGTPERGRRTSRENPLVLSG